LLDKSYAREKAEAIRRGEKAHVNRLSNPEASHTTHISVIDAKENAVSMTHSLGMPSGVVTEGLGFMYNGCMGVFDPRPGRTGSIAPGKSRFSSICPSIVFKNDRPFLIIGAPGGTQIAMGVLQVILNVIDFDMSMSDAVIAPRFSCVSHIVDLSARIPGYVCREVESMGYQVLRSYLSHGNCAWVHSIMSRDGELSGAADPAKGGMALKV
jgi:gamma-glutamyltranspeptidase/glutathione hydrolase